MGCSPAAECSGHIWGPRCSDGVVDEAPARAGASHTAAAQAVCCCHTAGHSPTASCRCTGSCGPRNSNSWAAARSESHCTTASLFRTAGHGPTASCRCTGSRCPGSSNCWAAVCWGGYYGGACRRCWCTAASPCGPAIPSWCRTHGLADPDPAAAAPCALPRSAGACRCGWWRGTAAAAAAASRP